MIVVYVTPWGKEGPMERKKNNERTLRREKKSKKLSVSKCGYTVCLLSPR
jgi:hypothetical protein